jgi:hypothetical protein
MTTEDVRLEFLAQQVDFLVEIESLLPKVKAYVNRKCLDQFIDEILPSKLWGGYKKSVAGNILTIENEYYKGSKYFHLTIFIGTGDRNNYYGVSGDKELIDASDLRLEPLKKVLEKHGASSWRNWLGYLYFSSRSRDEIWPISLSQDALSHFYEQWNSEFWEFAESVREPVEKVNESLK